MSPRLAVPDTARAHIDANDAGRLGSGLAPGEKICTTCDAGIGDITIRPHEAIAMTRPLDR